MRNTDADVRRVTDAPTSRRKKKDRKKFHLRVPAADTHQEEEEEEPRPAAQAAAGCFLMRSYTWLVLNEWEKSVTCWGFTASQPHSLSEMCMLILTLNCLSAFSSIIQDAKPMRGPECNPRDYAGRASAPSSQKSQWICLL